MRSLIRNVRIVSPYEVLEGYGLIIEEGIIRDIAKEASLDHREYERVVDGQGKYLAPGFIDIHNHGNSGFDIMDSSEEALDKMGEYHISNGVTSYLGTIITSSYEDTVLAIDNILSYENKDKKSDIVGIHLEGPFFNVEKKGAQPEAYIRKANLEYLKELVELTKGHLKMVSLAPELDGAGELISFLKEKNVAIAMGHTNASYEEAKLAIENGASIATHLYNGMREFNHREPGIVGAALTDDRVFCEIIYDRFHLHDAAVRIALSCKTSDKIILVSDAMRAAGLEDGIYSLGGQEVFVKDGKPRLKSGNIAGSSLNLQKAVYNMVHYLNIPLYEAVKMASLNPAKALNIDQDLGSIEIGKKADFILMDQDLNIEAVYKAGRLSYKR